MKKKELDSLKKSIDISLARSLPQDVQELEKMQKVLLWSFTIIDIFKKELGSSFFSYFLDLRRRYKDCGEKIVAIQNPELHKEITKEKLVDSFLSEVYSPETENSQKFGDVLFQVFCEAYDLIGCDLHKIKKIFYFDYGGLCISRGNGEVLVFLNIVNREDARETILHELSHALLGANSSEEDTKTLAAFLYQGIEEAKFLREKKKEGG